ncbi:hypothetical protein ACA910_010200 [Epithemia clementina (nom. ined.)]
MFLNFWLHPELRKYSGIDLTGLFSEELRKVGSSSKKQLLWEGWNRCAMGLSPSPYQATQSVQRVEVLALGNRRDPTNVFCWNEVILNLPGDVLYNPTRPWVYRVQCNGTIAADVYPYVDDMRETGPTEQDEWEAASRIAKAAAYYGLQDAARKRRPPSQRPGAWAGALIISSPDGVFKLVSEERWSKVKACINKNIREWAKETTVERKALEGVHGFLVYVSLTHNAMVPYL